MRDKFISIDDYIKSLPWRTRLSIWWNGRKIRRDFKSGKIKIRSYAVCTKCLRPIIEADDPACICTFCGGKNRWHPDDEKEYNERKGKVDG